MQRIWYPFDVFPAEDRPRLEKARGWWLYAEDGRRYADAISSWWVNLHGHAHPRLVQALQAQAGQMDQVMFAGFTHQPAEELSDWLCAHYQGMGKAFFSDDGSTAVEVALKMAVHYHFAIGAPRHKVLALKGAYHGDTFGAMSAAGHDVFTEPYSPLFFQVEHIGFSRAVDMNEPLTDFETEELLRAEGILSSGQVAACIVEPIVQGAAGMRLIRKAYLNALAGLCRAYNVLIIADEVMTGFYRTGKRFAMDWLDFRPDLVCLSKGLTGGFIPLGVTLATDELYHAITPADYRQRFLHGHSFSANPLACAVALESCRMTAEPESEEGRSQVFGWLAALANRLRQHPAIENLRQTGGLLAFEVRQGERAGYFSPVRERAYQYFMAEGILIRPLGRTLYLLPPHCPDAEAQTAIEKKLVEFCDRIAFEERV